MTLKEMQAVAAETLAQFIEVMPDCPFQADGIVVEFTPRAKMAQRTRELCEKYAPDKTINEAQAKQLVTDIGGNAIIGRDKSAVILLIDSTLTKQELRCVCFHEYMHIFCAKLEMDGEHFIDTYGSGTTPEREMTASEKQYDGMLVSGYRVWSEFIAQYYAIKHTDTIRPAVKQMSHYIDGMLSEVGHIDHVGEKYAMAFACARLLTCKDAEEQVSYLRENNEDDLTEQKAFQSCLFYLHEHMQTEKPWKITEVFIAGLGERYLYFKVTNSNFEDLLAQFGGGC